jgi:hypothetical protein
MKFSIALKNVDSEFKKIFESTEKLTQEEALKTVFNLKNDLVAQTPVDTGFARDSWSIEKQAKDFNLSNTAEYIQYLNDGSSVQAPARFIETTALKYGRPLGTIVEVT